MKQQMEMIDITERQMRKLLSRFTKIYRIQQKMSGCIDSVKTFALDGRIIGDVGECLASYLFDVALEKKQTKGHDGLYKRKVPVEIKVRTVSESNKLNHVHISDCTFKHDFYLIFFVFDIENKEIIIKTNAFISGNVLKDIRKTRTQKGFITFNKLKKCLNNNCYYKSIKIDESKKQNIAGWTILQEK